MSRALGAVCGRNLRANLPLACMGSACMGSACMPPHRQVRALAAMHSLGEVEKLEEGLLSKLTEVQVEHPRATPLPHGRNRPHVSLMAAVWP